MNGGLLYAYLAPRLKSRDLPKLLMWALMGRTRKYHAFATIASPEMWIETPDSRTIAVSTDGEVTMLSTPLRYRIARGALKVIVPAG